MLASKRRDQSIEETVIIGLALHFPKLLCYGFTVTTVQIPITHTYNTAVKEATNRN
jgi:hypothetical protein